MHSDSTSLSDPVMISHSFSSAVLLRYIIGEPQIK